MRKHLAFLRTVLRICVGLGASAAAIHCGASDRVTAVSIDDAGAQRASDLDAASTIEGSSGAALEPTHRGDGSAIDTGRDGGAIKVCGGAKGDPRAVPRLDWKIYAGGPKYAVVLGSIMTPTEPMYAQRAGSEVVGDVVEGIGGTVSGGTGPGAFGSWLFHAQKFAEQTMPLTDVSSPSDKRLGWSDALTGLFSARTEHAVRGKEVFRAAGRANTASPISWQLLRPTRTPLASSNEYYVYRITANRAKAWFFTLAFDHECKMQALEALIGSDNPLDILAPRTTATRADISTFLVDNDASLFLTALTIGGDDPSVRAALTGTQASPATLDHLETTVTALVAALDGFGANRGPYDYASVAAGTNPSWFIGEVTLARVSDLPP